MSALLGAATSTGRIPAQPPIGGAVWTIVVPAALLLVALLSTYLLYRHFSDE